MRLRVRLSMMTAAIAVPLFALLIYLTHLLLEREHSIVFAQLVVSKMEPIERAECERAPESWRTVLRPGRFADKRLNSEPKREIEAEAEAEVEADAEAEPEADSGPERVSALPPPPEAELRAWQAGRSSFTEEDLRATGTSGLLVHEDGPRRKQEMLVRMPWTSGPCRFIVARRIGGPRGPADRPTPILPVVAVTAVFLVAVILSAGPVIRRIRLLEQRVRAMASDGYRSSPILSGDDEVADLARAFGEAASEVRGQIGLAEMRERALREFLENTTHDVSTPLTVLLGHLKALDEEVRGNDVASATAAQAIAEAHYIALLIDNLSTAAKLQAGAPEFRKHPLDLCPLVERVVARHRPIAAQGGVLLEFSVPESAVLVDGDVTLLERAVSNVVDNAIRYNHRGGHVAVLLEAEAGTFRLRVCDDGPGISEEEAKRILERYYRGNAARTRDPNGRGLGLSIAAHVTQLHGFELKISRHDPEGTQFELYGDVLNGSSSSSS